MSDQKAAAIVVTPRGPYIASGISRITNAAGNTVPSEAEATLCRCGYSKNKPFCDGSHKGTGLTPIQYDAKAARKVWFCGCKKTSSQPVCDGTHNNV